MKKPDFAKFFRTIKRIFIALIVLAVAVLVAWIVVKCRKDEPDNSKLADTLAIVEQVRPRGEVYVCSAVMEDFVTRQATETRLLLFDKKHSCVQTLTQKCSYVIDLDQVEYSLGDSDGVVRVVLPPVRYVASTRSATFLSDDGDYWAAHLKSTNDMNAKVEAQIRQRFDTPDNRRKAQRYAEDAISSMLAKMGYSTDFGHTLQRVDE